jgi:hypothetical protein
MFRGECPALNVSKRFGTQFLNVLELESTILVLKVERGT